MSKKTHVSKNMKSLLSKLDEEGWQYKKSYNKDGCGAREFNGIYDCYQPNSNLMLYIDIFDNINDTNTVNLIYFKLIPHALGAGEVIAEISLTKFLKDGTVLSLAEALL